MKCSIGSSGLEGGGAWNMKSMGPPLVAIFFMTYFYRARGAWPPWHPPGSATEVSIRKLHGYLITICKKFLGNFLTIKPGCLIQEIHIFFVHFRDFLPRCIPPTFPKPHQQVPVPLRCKHSCQIYGNKMVNEQQSSIWKTKWYLIQISWKYPKFPTTSRNFEKLFIITAEDLVSQDLCTSVKKCNREWFTSLM